MPEGIKKTCPKGHIYYKSSDCPVCPVCEQEKTAPEFLSGFSAPAKRAILSAGIKTAKELGEFGEKELLKLHGIGKASLPLIRRITNEQKG